MRAECFRVTLFSLSIVAQLLGASMVLNTVAGELSESDFALPSTLLICGSAIGFGAALASIRNRPNRQGDESVLEIVEACVESLFVIVVLLVNVMVFYKFLAWVLNRALDTRYDQLLPGASILPSVAIAMSLCLGVMITAGELLSIARARRRAQSSEQSEQQGNAEH